MMKFNTKDINKNKLKIAIKQTRIPYSNIEKEKLFNDGYIRNMSNVQQSKKIYTRKNKHKKCF